MSTEHAVEYLAGTVAACFIGMLVLHFALSVECVA